MKKVMLVATSVMFVAGAAQANDPLLYDNGGPDGMNGYSNGSSAAAGGVIPDRWLLDDFVVPAGGWTITGFEHHHVWGGAQPAGTGFGMEIEIWSDAGGAPGGPIVSITPDSYTALE